MVKSGKVPVRERRSYKKFRQFMIHRDPVHTLLSKFGLLSLCLEESGSTEYNPYSVMYRRGVHKPDSTSLLTRIVSLERFKSNALSSISSYPVMDGAPGVYVGNTRNCLIVPQILPVRFLNESLVDTRTITVEGTPDSYLSRPFSFIVTTHRPTSGMFACRLTVNEPMSYREMFQLTMELFSNGFLCIGCNTTWRQQPFVHIEDGYEKASFTVIGVDNEPDLLDYPCSKVSENDAHVDTELKLGRILISSRIQDRIVKDLVTADKFYYLNKCGKPRHVVTPIGTCPICGYEGLIHTHHLSLLGYSLPKEWLAVLDSINYKEFQNVVCDAMGRFTTDIHPLDSADYAYIVHPVHVNK